MAASTTLSLDERTEQVRMAVRAKYRDPMTERCDAWAVVVYEDRVIVRKDEKLWSVAYTTNAEGEVELGDAPIEVRVAYEPVTESVHASVPSNRTGWVIGPVRESAEAEPTGERWDVIIIEEGMSANRNLYTRDVLQAASPLYEGARIFLDHDEEGRRFGRSAKDVVGFIKDVQPVLMGAREGSGAAQTFALAGTACITKRAFREELLDAHRMGKPDLYGLSHDVRVSKHQMVQGSDGKAAVKVEAIAKVSSVDFVTNPAAGGRVVRLVASDTPAAVLTEDGQMFEKLLAQLRALNRPDLVESLGATPTEDQVLEAIKQALSAAPAKADTAAVKEAVQQTAPTGIQVTQAHLDRLVESERVIAELTIERDVRACGLPEKLQDRLLSRLSARVAEGRIPTKAEITATIKEAVEDYGALAEAGVVVPRATTSVQMGASQADKVKQRLDDFFDPAKPAVSIKEAYVEITGDTKFTGRLDRSPRLRESLNSTSFDQALGDSITRRMLAFYNMPDFAAWQLIASIVPLQDFRTQRRVRFGGYGNLSIVNEGAPYTGMTSPTDEEATYSPAKRGGTESVTIEMIRNDDVGAIREIPRRLGRAAAQTLYEFVLDFMATNSAIYDSTALAAAGHGSNISTTALSATQIATLRLAMKNQTDMSSGKRLGISPRYLWVPNDLEQLAFEICSADKKVPDASLAASAEPAAFNFIKNQRIVPVVVDYWSDTNNYWLTASKDQLPMIEVGFLDGNQEPEIFVQDNPSVGSMFSNDSLTWKLRHVYGGAVMDFRGFAGGIVA